MMALQTASLGPEASFTHANVGYMHLWTSKERLHTKPLVPVGGTQGIRCV
jgi:hypothetical protein